jgi:DNA polymerase I
MQSNGSEMLRLACCLATERGVRVTAPIHDAVLIEADAATEEQEITACRDAMAEASRGVLGGLEVKTDVKVVRWPDRYADERGALMWRRVTGLLEEVERSEGRLVESGKARTYIIKKEELGKSWSYLPASNLPTLEPSSLIDMAGS